jgi:Flp pilus assembly pilin Flp
MKSIVRFLKDEKGLETVEYAVMTALIVTALVLAIGELVDAVSTRFDTVEGIIESIA